jgi:hypothetical protein
MGKQELGKAGAQPSSSGSDWEASSEAKDTLESTAREAEVELSSEIGERPCHIHATHAWP